MNTRIIAAALAASVFVSAAAAAQTAPTSTAPAVQKPGLLSRILHRGKSSIPNRPGTTATTPGVRIPMLKGMAGVTGTIIGNKKTLVYHMPTDHNLPSPKNRVYFKTVNQAIAAGYHAPGTPMNHASAPKTRTGRGYQPPVAGVQGH